MSESIWNSPKFFQFSILNSSKVLEVMETQLVSPIKWQLGPFFLTLTSPLKLGLVSMEIRLWFKTRRNASEVHYVTNRDSYSWLLLWCQRKSSVLNLCVNSSKPWKVNTDHLVVGGVVQGVGNFNCGWLQRRLHVCLSSFKYVQVSLLGSGAAKHLTGGQHWGAKAAELEGFGFVEVVTALVCLLMSVVTFLKDLRQTVLFFLLFVQVHSSSSLGQEWPPADGTLWETGTSEFASSQRSEEVLAHAGWSHFHLWPFWANRRPSNRRWSLQCTDFVLTVPWLVENLKKSKNQANITIILGCHQQYSTLYEE